MKNCIMGLAIIVTGVGAVQAQSALTMYGRVASGFDFITNVATGNGQSKNNFRYGSNQYGSSWIGLKGGEDLGGGWRAVFNLETQYTLGTGQLPDQTYGTDTPMSVWPMSVTGVCGLAGP